ncbi:MAG: 2-C-methyl-D-erythritol 4-phosphate cytidylyltransferase [Lachnospiraceae bacterium]|nr:2-C-methyl-D-erythritol 4-phosphate cytidylyltransferase [Lachnospiraceae bacterium]
MKDQAVYALILSGGTGLRCATDVPKQYLKSTGKMMITHCMEALCSSERVRKLVIIADETYRKAIEDEWKSSGSRGEILAFGEPGANRQLSIWNGLKLLQGIAAEGDIVLVHDAARPFVTAALIDRCLNACADHEGAMPVLPMKDTVYLTGADGRVNGLLERDRVVAGQAPEAFLYGKYLAANESLLPEKILSIRGSSEPAILAGMDVVVVDGDEKNRKVTTPTDLENYYGHFQGEETRN